VRTGRTASGAILFPRAAAGNIARRRRVQARVRRRGRRGYPWRSTMRTFLHWLRAAPTDGPRSILLLRLMAGGVFLWRGILKFVSANQGVGRFTKLGFPWPGPTATFVGCFEIVGGLLLLFGLMTRFVALPFIIEMVVAILSTKISLYLGTYPLAPPPAPPV